MDLTVIRIRYRDLSTGLHGKAERTAPQTTVYLQPGLTMAQRKAALRRLRQEAQRGCGPRLPAGQLALALAADRARLAIRQVLSIIRLHPATALAPALFVGLSAAMFLVAAVPAQAPRQSGPSAVSPAQVATMIGGTAPVGPGRLRNISA
jgi:hypothetical protein